MAGDYGSITFENGLGSSIDRFGAATNSPDLIAQSQGGVFTLESFDALLTSPNSSTSVLDRLDLVVAGILAPQEYGAEQSQSQRFARNSDNDTPTGNDVLPNESDAVAAPVEGSEAPEISDGAPVEPKEIKDSKDADKGCKPAGAAGVASPDGAELQPDCRPGAQGQPPTGAKELAKQNTAPPEDQASSTEIAVLGLLGAQAWRGKASSDALGTTRKNSAMRFDVQSGTWRECEGMVEGAIIGNRLSLGRSVFEGKETRAPLVSTPQANAPYKGVDDVAIVVTYDGTGSAAKSASIDWGKRKSLESVE